MWGPRFMVFRLDERHSHEKETAGMNSIHALDSIHVLRTIPSDLLGEIIGLFIFIEDSREP